MCIRDEKEVRTNVNGLSPGNAALGNSVYHSLCPVWMLLRMCRLLRGTAGHIFFYLFLLLFCKDAYLGNSINIKERQYSGTGSEIGQFARRHCAPWRAAQLERCATHVCERHGVAQGQIPRGAQLILTWQGTAFALSPDVAVKK